MPNQVNQPNLEIIDTAFLQLSFALKLWHFLDVHPIEKESFDIALTVEDEGSLVVLQHDEFPTYDAIKVASETNVSICFGAVANTLWEAISEKYAFSSRQLNPEADRTQNLASLAYMIRCCFAHRPASPVWCIQDRKYRTTYRVGNKVIDLSNIKNGTPFEYASIHGYETLWMLKAEALEG